MMELLWVGAVLAALNHQNNNWQHQVQLLDCDLKHLPNWRERDTFCMVCNKKLFLCRLFTKWWENYLKISKQETTGKKNVVIFSLILGKPRLEMYLSVWRLKLYMKVFVVSTHLNLLSDRKVREQGK